MEVYVDDKLIKSLKMEDHIHYLDEAYQILRRYKMRLNSFKCDFGFALRKFLDFMVNQIGIEANLEKINALVKMRSPQKLKEVQSLIGRIAALRGFFLRATLKCLPFFKILKGVNKFQWTKECE